MKHDYTNAKNIYIVCGRTDMGKLQWPKDENEVRLLSQRELRWLLESLSIQQPKAIPPSLKGSF